MDFNVLNLPTEIVEAAEAATLSLLPEKSKKTYDNAYRRFEDWCHLKNVNGINETVLLAYFSERSKQVKSSSLWSEYSMVRAQLMAKQNMNIKTYARLQAFLKRNSVGYRPKKAKVFLEEEMQRFYKEAPDDKYLAMKIVMLFGLYGACRRDEIHKLTIDDIEDKGTLLIVNIEVNKTDHPRSFVVSGEMGGVNVLNLYRKYISLRKPETPHRRLFVFYSNGKCSTQPIGINTIGKVPINIAKFLNLENPELYTGHAFRRSSASLLSNKGADITTLKRHGGWKSNSVAEGYVEESISRKINVANLLFGESAPDIQAKKSEFVVGQSSVPSAITIQNCNNCEIKININSK